ncbi:hypothetical protein SSCG_00353 [Streptomyces clavuligerus]|nr:hypothetical protein SSCG_00353 [Streptomyces clavuligerus]
MTAWGGLKALGPLAGRIVLIEGAVGGAANDPALLTGAAGFGAQGRCTPRIEQTYPLEEIAQAHAHSEPGHVRGKIVTLIQGHPAGRRLCALGAPLQQQP